MQDIILKNGTIIDGTGAKSYTGDVAVKDGKISKIALEIGDDSAMVVDVSGLVVAPGFIDIHSHGDTTFLIDPRAESKVCQGVTSELAGQCGSTIYPCPDDRMDNIRAFAKPGSVYDSDHFASGSFQQFMDKCKAGNKKMGTNLISLIGHGALRTGVMGLEGRKATSAELDEMCALLDRDMKSGAWGLSLGLGYAPGVNADLEELIALGHVVKKYDGVITSHMRDQGDDIFTALEEMYNISRATGVKIHIAHLKISGKKNWGKTKELMESIRGAQAEGIPVTADMYPYPASSSGITNSFPKWSIEGGTEMAVKHLQGPRRQEIIDFLSERFVTKEDGEGLLVVTTLGKFPQAEGKNIWQISQELGIGMVETIEKITLATNSYALCIAFTVKEEDVDDLLRQKDIAIGSDGSGYPFDEAKNQGRPHPRNFGTFPRFLRLVREEGLCSLETAVHRMTGMSAGILALPERGLLKEGYIADITVFNKDTVRDNNDFKNPFVRNTGITHVLINGKFALKDEVQTDNLLGAFLLKE